MSDRQIRAGDLGVTRLLYVFATLAVVFLGVLAIAPARSKFTEWRAIQKRYGALAIAQGKEPLDPGILQIWNPKLDVVDRCTSCHVGAGPTGAVAGDKLFAAHPPIPHDVEQFGCTLCHGGQGRATTVKAAHGLTRHWDEPLLPQAHVEAGCGTCHSHLRIPSEAASLHGDALFRRYDCLACHRMDGAGRATGTDLSWIGIKGVEAGWHERHMQRRAAAVAAKAPDARVWEASYGEIPAADTEVIEGYLETRVGAPALLAAKTLAHRLGCRGCHKVNGVGGDDGPDLTAVGRKIEADLDYGGVRGEHTLANWLFEHFKDPGRVVRGSLMPDLGLTDAEAEVLTRYMLSLRAVEVPEAFWPRDKIRGLRLGEREFATDGASLYGTFCAGCHGPRGEGRRYATLGVVFPAIGHPDFLALASDDYLRKTITSGRPGRRMPAWGEKEGGLTAREIDAIVGYLRSLAPGTPEAVDLALPAGDAARGEVTFARSCAGCHGARGEGKEAPAIGHPNFLAAATDDYIAGTMLRGREGTSMRHFGQPTVNFPTMDAQEAADVVAHLRRLAPATDKGSKP